MTCGDRYLEMERKSENKIQIQNLNRNVFAEISPKSYGNFDLYHSALRTFSKIQKRYNI